MKSFEIKTWSMIDHLKIYAIVETNTTQAVALYHDKNEAKIDLAIRNSEQQLSSRHAAKEQRKGRANAGCWYCTTNKGLNGVQSNCPMCNA